MVNNLDRYFNLTQKSAANLMFFNFWHSLLEYISLANQWYKQDVGVGMPCHMMAYASKKNLR